MINHYKNNFSSKDMQEDVPFKRDNIVYLDIPKLIILLKDGGVTSKQSARFMNVSAFTARAFKYDVLQKVEYFNKK